MKKKVACSVKEDKSQIFLYETPGFSAYIKKNVYPENMPFCVTDHWHDEVEFVYVSSGSIQYKVEGQTLILHEGQGLFINSRKLHVALADRNVPCEFICAIFHPMLLCASKFIDQTFVEPIIHNDNLKYLIIENDSDWGKCALDIIEKMYELSLEERGHLLIEALFLQLWDYIYKHTVIPEAPQIKPNHHLSTLKDMISYIQQNFQEKISLEDISASGAVGKTMCTNLFNTYVNKTPIEFLRDYRIQQSIVLLKTTDYSVTEICYETGFSSASYYGECFRKVVGCSPLEYRQENSSIPLSHYSRKRRPEAL